MAEMGFLAFQFNGNGSHRHNYVRRWKGEFLNFHLRLPKRMWKISWTAFWNHNADIRNFSNWMSEQGFCCRVRNLRNEIRKSAWPQIIPAPREFQAGFPFSFNGQQLRCRHESFATQY